MSHFLDSNCDDESRVRVDILEYYSSSIQFQPDNEISSSPFFISSHPSHTLASNSQIPSESLFEKRESTTSSFFSRSLFIFSLQAEEERTSKKSQIYRFKKKLLLHSSLTSSPVRKFNSSNSSHHQKNKSSSS